MSCVSCVNSPETMFYTWRGTDVQVVACTRHLDDIRAALDRAQDRLNADLIPNVPTPAEEEERRKEWARWREQKTAELYAHGRPRKSSR